MSAAKANNNKDTYKATAITLIVFGVLYLADKLLHFSTLGLSWVMNRDNFLLYTAVIFLLFKNDKSVGLVLTGLWLILNFGLITALLGTMSAYLLPVALLVVGGICIWYLRDKMKRSIEDTSVVFIGAGNLATNLAKALYYKGFRIVQVYSRTEESARTLAQAVEAAYTTDLSSVAADARLYIVSLKDAAFVQLLPEIVAGKENALWVHTAGSIPMDVWAGKVNRYGVFYPMQTFSKQRTVDFRQIPVFVESNSAEDTRTLKDIASVLSENVYEADSEQRKSLHLAAVFTCNFTNHMYALAAGLLKKYGLPFEVMLPLIDETARKVHELEPRLAQTGPAVRYDENVIGEHLQMLSDEPDMQELYRLISESIHRQNS